MFCAPREYSKERRTLLVCIYYNIISHTPNYSLGIPGIFHLVLSKGGKKKKCLNNYLRRRVHK